MTTTKSLGFAGRLALGLICCALGACTSSDSGSPAGSGGTGAGQGGTSGGSAGTTGTGTGTAGTTGAGATTGSGGASTGGSGAGASTGTAGDGAGTGGTFAGTGGALSGTGGAGTAGSGAATGGSAGASAGTGGTAGGAGAGAGGAGGASDCNGAALCDSFERTALGANWKLDNSVTANVVEIVTDQAHTGTSSVHIKYGTASGATFIDETLGFPVMNNSIWGRVWFFMMTGTEGGHHVFIEASDGMAVQMNGVRPLNTQGNIATNIDPPDSGGTSKVPMPQGVWTCFEWHIAAAAGKTNVNLYMNGTEVPGTAASVTATGNNVVSSLIETRIGYERYGTGAAGEMWMDDFAVGPMQIGCSP